MGYPFYSRQHIALGANTSNLTGATWLSVDYRQITVSIQSSTASASRYTIAGTNDDGLTKALGTPSPTINQNGWSILTTITSAGQYTIDAGVRWMTCFRDGISVSAASNVTMTFQGRT